MKSRASELFEGLQKKLPDVTFYWEKEPDPHYDTKSCSLVGFRNASPENKATMSFEDGISERVEGESEQLIEQFIESVAAGFVTLLNNKR